MTSTQLHYYIQDTTRLVLLCYMMCSKLLRILYTRTHSVSRTIVVYSHCRRRHVVASYNHVFPFFFFFFNKLKIMRSTGPNDALVYLLATYKHHNSHTY